MRPPREKKHRLPAAAYYGKKAVSFTACVEGRIRLFVDGDVVREFLGVLEKWVTAKKCTAPIYCFMPDHLHVIVMGMESSSNAKDAMDEFKKTTGLWLARDHPGVAWQKDFHDHVIRSSDDWRRHVIYVYANPVRAGLVEDGADYPFTGSIGWDLKELIHSAIE